MDDVGIGLVIVVVLGLVFAAGVITGMEWMLERWEQSSRDARFASEQQPTERDHGSIQGDDFA